MYSTTCTTTPRPSKSSNCYHTTTKNLTSNPREIFSSQAGRLISDAYFFFWGGGVNNKKAPNFSVRGSGGGYLLSHFRSTIGVVRLNFSVRNGKRWIPHAITTLMRLRPLPFLFCCALQLGGPCIFGDASTDKPRMAVSLSR